MSSSCARTRLSYYSLPAILLAVILLAGCGSGSDAENAEATGERKAVVGVSLLTLTHPFFQDMVDAMEEEAERQNFELVVTSCEFDAARQQNQVSDFVVQSVDAIVLAPCDSKSVGTAIGEANGAGIPVFTADIAVLAESADVVSHVATDNYQGGRLAGEAILEAIDRQGNVAIIDHPEVESVIQRTTGFRDVIEEANQNGARVEIVAQLPGGGVKDRAFRTAEDMLQAHSNLDAIFAINDDTALGAVAAIEKAGKQGDVLVVGFDGTLEARRAIRDGKIYADIIQHPKDIGRQTIQSIAAYMAGETLEPETLIPATVYRQSNAQADSLIRPVSAP